MQAAAEGRAAEQTLQSRLDAQLGRDGIDAAEFDAELEARLDDLPGDELEHLEKEIDLFGDLVDLARWVP